MGRRPVRRLVLGLVVAAAAVGATACEPPPAPTPVALILPSASAFAVLGHSCGGVRQQVLATGFDVDGQATGVAYLQTTCSSGGRGGNTVTYRAWVAVTWDLTAAVTSYVELPTATSGLDPALSVTDADGDVVANTVSAVNVPPANCSVGNVTYCTYRATLTVPIPGAPTGVAVQQSEDSLLVTWAPPSVGGHAVTSSTVSAVPVGGGATLTVHVAGGATTASVDGVAPGTPYAVAVSSTSAGGTGPSSAPVSVTTHVASVVPSAPGALTAARNGGATALAASWSTPVGGDSPVDGYQVEVAQSDPTGPPTAFDVGTATSASLPGFDSTLDWSIRVRAHNAAGWGAWSVSVVVPAAD